MSPRDRERLAAACRERGLPEPALVGTVLVWPRRNGGPELAIVGRTLAWSNRAIGSFTGRGWVERLADAVAREMGREGGR